MMTMTAKTRAFLIASSLMMLPASTAQADDSAVCNYYGNIGAAAVDFLLPLTLQDVVGIITGQDEELAQKFADSIQRRTGKASGTAITAFGADAPDLLGESAGFLSFQLLVSGQITNGGEAFKFLYDACTENGAAKIVENQRKTRESFSEGKAQ